MPNRQTRLSATAMRSASVNAVVEAKAIYETTQIGQWHQRPEVSEFEVPEKSHTMTNDLDSPVTLRGDMLVW